MNYDTEYRRKAVVQALHEYEMRNTEDKWAENNTFKDRYKENYAECKVNR